MTAADIVQLLNDNGITAQEEYYANDVSTPYAVVLTPYADIDSADMIPQFRGRGFMYTQKQAIRIELYTKNKTDPIRAELLKLIFTKIQSTNGYRLEEESYGKNRLYMTAVEFTVMLQESI